MGWDGMMTGRVFQHSVNMGGRGRKGEKEREMLSVFERGEE